MRAHLGHPLTILAGLALAMAVLAATPAPAAAHARLAASNPANGAALDEMPARVTLTFTEPVASGSGRVTLGTTLPNDPLAAGPVVADGAGVAVTLVGGRPDPLHDHGSGTNLLDADTRRLPNGHLFGWIAGGVPGATMPAYDEALTDERTLALVAYLRTLQRARPPDIPPPPT